MPTNTTKLNLVKPLKSEKYNVNVFNSNADKIDTFADLVDTQLADTDKRIDNLVATPVPTGEIIAEEIIDARDGEVSVGAKIRSIDAQLAQAVSVVGGDSDVIWNPPTQPSSNDILWSGSSTRLTQFYALWEGLRAEHPTYVTRELLGKDQSGLYDIWKYIFEPVNYEKTVILTSNTHGSEMEGQKILYRFMYHICNDALTDTHMSYMRNKVRIVVIPMVNPWGVQNATRTNFRGVDINRNFQFGWNICPVGTGTVEYKGTAPLSEAETQYVNNVMQQYANDGTVAYVDVHAGAEYTPNINTAFYYAEVPERGDSAHSIIHEVIHGVTPDGFTPEKLVLKRINPNTVNQADMVYGLHAVTPEFEPGMVYGVTPYSSQDIHSGLKWIGNIILQFSRLKNRKRDSAEPFAFEVSNNDTTFMTSTLAYETVPNTQFVFTPEVDGILYVTGEYQFVNANTSANNFMTVNIHQGGNPLLTTNYPVMPQEASFEVMTSLGGRPMTLTSARAVPIYAADKNHTPVTITIRVRTDAGNMTARRSRLHGMFIPTKKIPAYTAKQITNGVVQVDYPVAITIDS